MLLISLATGWAGILVLLGGLCCAAAAGDEEPGAPSHTHALSGDCRDGARPRGLHTAHARDTDAIKALLNRRL